MAVIHYVPISISGPDPVVLIISSAYSSLPAPGNRVGPSDAANMPTIQASTGNNAIKTADGAHNYRLVGLNIKAPTTLLQGSIVAIGGQETTLAEFPTDITIDRCIVRGDATVGARRGVQLDGIRCAVIDSYIYDCKEDGADSQAVWAYNTPGPLKIVNNYLEAAGENVMFGGADPSYTNAVPSDIEIRRNYFKKQPYASWAASWDIKNLLEFKNAQRVLVEGNVLDTNYSDAQSGFGVLITPRNQSGTASWCTTRDITLRHNKLLNSEQGITVSRTDSDYTSQDTYRVSVENNLFEIADMGGTWADWRTHQLLGGPIDVQFINNTFLYKSGTSIGQGNFMECPSPKALRTIWRNNIIFGDTLGNGIGAGTAGLNGHNDPYTFSYNMMVASAGSYTSPVANCQFPASIVAAKFVDYAGGDYALASDSPGHNAASDGGDIGANFTTLNSMTLHAIDGLWGSEPATYTDSSYTNAEMPRTYIDTTYRAQTGNVIYCNSGDNLQTKIDSAVPGDTIIVEAGATFTGSFILRNT